MEPIYWGISWLLLRWEWWWQVYLNEGRFLGTDWIWVLSIIALAVPHRLALTPLVIAQIQAHRNLQAVAPKARQLQATFRGDQRRLRQELTMLYQREGINPAAGCLPLLVQLPLFFGLFHVLLTRNPLVLQPAGDIVKTDYGWTEAQFDSIAGAQLFQAPLAATFGADASTLAALGGGNALAVKIVAGTLIFIMAVTTWLATWQVSDRSLTVGQRIVSFVFPMMLALLAFLFPIGVTIYWVVQNIITLYQQNWMLRLFPAPTPA